MKQRLVVFLMIFLLCFAFGCQKKGEQSTERAAPVIDIEAEKAAVKDLIDQLGIAFETRDFALVSRIYAHDSDMVIIGTDTEEIFVGWEPWKEAILEMFAEVEEADKTTKILSIKVNESGKAAWVSAIVGWKLKVAGTPLAIEGLRATYVAEKRNGNWLIVHYHASMSVEGQVVEY